MARASAVHNRAALLASDCGLPDLAREWCHRHADAYLRARFWFAVFGGCQPVA